MGSFEECIPLVPLAVVLAVAMGWDEMVGLGMSLGAVACGFATGVLNPFTTGVAQTLMGLPVFSGISLRLLTFVMIFGCRMLYLFQNQTPQGSNLFRLRYADHIAVVCHHCRELRNE